MEQKLSYTYQALDSVIGKAATSCNVSPAASAVSIVYKNVGGMTSFTARLTSASSTNAGLMTAEAFRSIGTMKAEVAELKEKVKDTNAFADSVSVKQNAANYLSFVFSNNGVESFTMEVPLATATHAGIISAGQYKTLENGCAVFSAEKVSRVNKIRVAANYEGVLCFDEYDNQLCLRVTANGRSSYHAVWTADKDPNGMSAIEYRNERFIINASGTLAVWSGAGWIQAGTGGTSMRTALITEEEFEQLKQAENLVEGVLYLTY